MESQLLHFKQTINTMTLERDAHLRKIDELIHENAQLDLLNKSIQYNESFNKENDNDSFLDHIGKFYYNYFIKLTIYTDLENFLLSLLQ